MRVFPLRVLVVAISVALAGCGAKSPEEHLSNARQALQNNDLKTAEIELKSVLQASPGNAEARLLLARTLQDKSSWADSEKELRKAQEQGASPEQTLPMLARALVKMGKYQEAADLEVPSSGMGSHAVADLQAERAVAFLALDKVAEAARSVAEGERVLAASGAQEDLAGNLRLSKARLALAENQSREAMAILDGILAKDAKFIEALYLKAQLLGAQGRYDEALKVYEQIIATKPNEVLARLAIVERKLQANDVAAADKALKATEAIAPNMLLVKYARAKVSFLKGELKLANEALQLVMRTAPDHLPSVLLDAEINYGLGNYEQSLKSANKVLARVPGQVQAARLVAANELRRGNYIASIDILTPILKSNPNDIRTLSLLGEAHMQAKQYDKAMEYLVHASSVQPKNPAFVERQARVHLALGKTEQALREFEHAVSLTDTVGQADMSLVMLLLGRKDYDKALQAIAAMEKKLPNNPVTSNLRGGAYLGKGDRMAARKAFEQALALKADFFPAAANLARMDEQEKKLDVARKRYETILMFDEKNIQAMMALAQQAAYSGNERGYLTWLEKAARTEPAALPPRAGLVRYYLSKKNTQKALLIAREMADTKPVTAQALVLLGTVQMASSDVSGALASFSRAVEQSPDSAEPRYRLGLAQMAGKKYAEARNSLQKTLDLNPRHVEAFDRLLQIDIAQKDIPSALQRARSFQAKNPDRAVGYIREADILASQGKYKVAVDTYEKALAKHSDYQTFARLWNTLYRSGQRKVADSKLADWLNKYPGDEAAQRHAAEYYMRSGRRAESIKLYEGLRARHPNDALVLNNLAVLYQVNDDKRALETAELAYKLKPDHPAIMDTLGWMLVGQGKATRGLELLTQAAKRLPSSPVLQYRMAVAHAKLGHKAPAIEILKSALDKFKDFPQRREAERLLETLSHG